jgi:NAD(P)-dependent dehydrogenase (short-subunit alcohol dehydrogenase family)
MKTDRIVVITGAAGGMGKLAVDRFLANGDTVVATDTSDKTLKALADSQAPEAKLHTVVGDISKEEDCAGVAALASDVGGRVDVLVNVAGFSPSRRSTR